MSYGRRKLTKEVAQNKLRKLELEAYAAVIGAFRASGHLDWGREKLLLRLREELRISGDRHCIEMTKVDNDEIVRDILESLGDFAGGSRNGKRGDSIYDDDLDAQEPYAFDYAYDTPSRRKAQGKSRKATSPRARGSRASKSAKSGQFQQLMKRKKELLKDLERIQRDKEQADLLSRREELMRLLGDQADQEPISPEEQVILDKINEIASKEEAVKKSSQEKEEQLKALREKKENTQEEVQPMDAEAKDKDADPKEVQAGVTTEGEVSTAEKEEGLQEKPVEPQKTEEEKAEEAAKLEEDLKVSSVELEDILKQKAELNAKLEEVRERERERRKAEKEQKEREAKELEEKERAEREQREKDEQKLAETNAVDAQEEQQGAPPAEAPSETHMEIDSVPATTGEEEDKEMSLEEASDKVVERAHSEEGLDQQGENTPAHPVEKVSDPEK